ncbi:hypothetical protein ASG25_04660 [Rhizobium sp. Leaf384]|uniref:hypothetical protein n=1 Tax=unclassified Rhizobium TaxID=2613769 RepID=UPI00071518BC|nr:MULTISPECIES: hypothetical protein [unclassified Rhizobium]KQS77249.1 hypothetical protein ASG58_09590 [Rhizobium sp. Leaf383]KQS80828.1 hypothetical protein ASG25_04660 [Rhizobium sp. Leaf384]
MNTLTASVSTGEAPLAIRRHLGNRPAVSTSEPPAQRRFPCRVRFAEVETDLEMLIDKAIAAIAEGEPADDEILGHYVHVASLVRAISFREGKLLEQAVERLSKANPDLIVLTQSIKLPLVKTAIEAIAGNAWHDLDGIKFDSEAPAKGSYTPDLIIVNRVRHSASILDLKRSLASYGDTSRLEELKAKMMATAMILPDWLYKNQKRVMVDTVGVAIVDGASRPSSHETGIWALSEIDDLLEIDGAAACMAELRRRFGIRVQQLLEAEARKALGLVGVTPAATAEARPTSIHRPMINLNALGADGMDDDEDAFPFEADEQDEPAVDLPLIRQPQRIRVGFARRLLDS